MSMGLSPTRKKAVDVPLAMLVEREMAREMTRLKEPRRRGDISPCRRAAG